MQVILFDIDGTLINTGGAGGTALKSAFAAEFEVPVPQDVPFSGRTDRAIAGQMFAAHAIDDTSENWNRLRAGYLERLHQHLPQHQGCVLPGVERLLQQLGQCAEVLVGLLTGNVRDGARVKLAYYGLVQHFAFGGYGDDHRDRDDVAREALAAAERHANGRSAGDSVWVVGDTPLDIQCARAIGARVLAVATGIHRRSELEARHPDVMVDDLANERVVDILLR